MPDGEILYSYDMHFVEHMRRFLGETVTIFTTSGGESGSGFTGVLTYVNPEYVRLVTSIGAAPECGLGNACDCDYERGEDFYPRRRFFRRRFIGRRAPYSGLGSVVDIPVSRIASFVHNTL